MQGEGSAEDSVEEGGAGGRQVPPLSATHTTNKGQKKHTDDLSTKTLKSGATANTKGTASHPQFTPLTENTD